MIKEKEIKNRKGIGQKRATGPYRCSFCPISFRLSAAECKPYLPCFQRWVWLGHCSWSHTPGISPKFYPGPPWTHSHESCRFREYRSEIRPLKPRWRWKWKAKTTWMIWCIMIALPENGQGNILLPRAVFTHADAKARTEEQLSRGDQVALLRGFKLQHSWIPDKSMEFAKGRKGTVC